MFMIQDYVRTEHDLLLTGGRDIHSVGQFISFRRQQWRRHHQPGGRGGQLLHHRGGRPRTPSPGLRFVPDYLVAPI